MILVFAIGGHSKATQHDTQAKTRFTWFEENMITGLEMKANKLSVQVMGGCVRADERATLRRAREQEQNKQCNQVERDQATTPELSVRKRTTLKWLLLQQEDSNMKPSLSLFRLYLLWALILLRIGGEKKVFCKTEIRLYFSFQIPCCLWF